MPATFRDTYLLNGWNLRNLATTIEASDGLQDAPELRDNALTVPGAHGVLSPEHDLARPRRRYGPGQLRLKMSVLGVDPHTGAPPLVVDDPWLYLRRLDELQRRFSARVLNFVHPRTGGDRAAAAYLAEPIRVVREPSSPLFGRFEAICTIPAAFWRDTTDTTVTTGAVSTGGTVSLAALAGTAPIVDAGLHFTAASNPQLTHGATYWRYGGVVSAGRQLAAACALRELDDSAGTAWTPSIAAVAYGPGPGWFELDPTATPLRATFTHTGGGTATATITARRAWLTS